MIAYRWAKRKQLKMGQSLKFGLEQSTDDTHVAGRVMYSIASPIWLNVKISGPIYVALSLSISGLISGYPFV